MSNWHGSLSSLQIPRGSKRRRQFVPPPRKVAVVPWSSVDQMARHCPNMPSGEWRLSTNQWGHVQGLPHLQGAKVAIGRANKALLWDGENSLIEICSTNFVGHHEERE